MKLVPRKLRSTSSIKYLVKLNHLPKENNFIIISIIKKARFGEISILLVSSRWGIGFFEPGKRLLTALIYWPNIPIIPSARKTKSACLCFNQATTELEWYWKVSLWNSYQLRKEVAECVRLRCRRWRKWIKRIQRDVSRSTALKIKERADHL